MEMDMDQIEVTTNPPGEEVSPELTEEVAGTPVTPEVEPEVKAELTQEEVEDKAELDASGLQPDTPAAHKWAEMRRNHRDAKKVAEEAQLEAARWRGRAEALAERGQVKDEVPAQPAPETYPKPTEDAFDDYTAYIEALADWKADIKLAEYDAKQVAKEVERTKGERAKESEKWFSTGKTKFSDFDAVVTKAPEDGGPAITLDMASVINSSQVSHELAYHLGKNVTESRRIAALPPLEMAREMGRLEAKLTSGTTVKPRIQTNAPVPIRPIEGSGATATTTDIEKMNEAEFIAYRNRQEFGDRKR